MSLPVSRIFHLPLLAITGLALSAACWSQQLPPILSQGYPVGIEDDGEVIWVVAWFRTGRAPDWERPGDLPAHFTVVGRPRETGMGTLEA